VIPIALIGEGVDAVLIRWHAPTEDMDRLIRYGRARLALARRGVVEPHLELRCARGVRYQDAWRRGQPVKVQSRGLKLCPVPDPARERRKSWPMPFVPPRALSRFSFRRFPRWLA
jgi:hypothetical protein